MARALVPAPPVLLLSEPSAGLAPEYVDLVFQKIVEIRRAGVSVLLVEQNARRALALSDRGYVLELGRKRFEDSGAALLEHKMVETYAGDESPRRKRGCIGHINRIRSVFMAEVVEMRADDVRSSEAMSYGAYLCLRVPGSLRRAAAGMPIPALIDRLELQNEFEPGAAPSANTIAFLRRVDVAPGDIADGLLLEADAVVHVASAKAAPVTEFCVEAARLLGPAVATRVLDGVVRPLNYTGNAMYNFAYAHRVLQQPGGVMPNAFLVPMTKTPEWWAKGWMERHTYFLPRYDDAGHMVSEGHVLAAADGIPCLMRRTYKYATEPAPAGAYDFVTYFECRDEDVPVFHAVCRALRDVKKNPEWRFVREGPTWHGRRIATWAKLFE